MEKELNFIVMYGKETFFFKQGSKAFILHTGIENQIDKKYGIQGLREYTAFVHDCYVWLSGKLYTFNNYANLPYALSPLPEG